MRIRTVGPAPDLTGQDLQGRSWAPSGACLAAAEFWREGPAWHGLQDAKEKRAGDSSLF